MFGVASQVAFAQLGSKWSKLFVGVCLSAYFVALITGLVLNPLGTLFYALGAFAALLAMWPLYKRIMLISLRNRS